MAIVTISRGSMSGGQALAECVSKALQAPCVGREILVDAAAKLGVPESLLAGKLERGPGLWDRLTLERQVYVAALQAALAEHAAAGNLVYHGYAGHILLRGLPGVLRVRLIAPFPARVRALVEREGLAAEEAERAIARRDQDRAEWTRAMYGVDLVDPQLYDLVVNLERLSVQSGCAVVVEATRRPELAVTEEVKGRLGDFALEARVRVALALEPASRGLGLEVVAAGGLVRVRGELPSLAVLGHASERLGREIAAIVRKVEGVSEVSVEIREREG